MSSSSSVKFVDFFFSLSLQSLIQESNDVIDERSSMERHPLHLKYKPNLLYQFPLDYSIPQHLPLFCFPNGISLLPAKQQRPKPHFHTFIMTQETGIKQFYAALIFYEPLGTDLQQKLQQQIQQWQQNSETELEFAKHLNEKIQILKQQLREEASPELEEKLNLFESQYSPYKLLQYTAEQVYMPICIGLGGHWPFYGTFRDWLWLLYKKVSIIGKLNVPIERMITNFISEIPLPPCGKLELRISFEEYQLKCSRPPLNTIPLIQSFSLYTLFSLLSIDQIVSVFEHVIAESKILLISSHYSHLNLITESLLLFLFPFYWPHVLIPILPRQLLNYIHAPVPFIIGIHSSFRQLEQPPNDVLQVDLDKGKLYNQQPIVRLPLHEKRKLQQRLKKYCKLTGRLNPNPDDFLWTGENIRQQLKNEQKFKQIERDAKITSSILFKHLESAKEGDNGLIHKMKHFFIQQPPPLPPKDIHKRPSFSSEDSSSIYSTLTQTQEVQPKPETNADEEIKRTFFHQLSNLMKIGETDGEDDLESRASSQEEIGLGLKPKKPLFNWPSTTAMEPADWSQFNYYYPFKPKPNRKEEQRIHILFNLPQEYKHAIDYENQMPNLNPCVLPNKEIKQLEGHQYWNIFIVTQSQQSLNDLLLKQQQSPTLSPLPTSIPLGLCAVCHENVEARLVLAQSSVMTSQGLAYAEKSEPNESRAYQCQGCKKVAHSDCLRESQQYCPRALNEVGIRDSFLRLWTSLLRQYRPYIHNITDYLNTFQDKESRAFMTSFCQSQSFQQFQQDRMEKQTLDYEILFFDESIKEKLNRSKIRMSKESTPFLQDPTFEIKQPLDCLRPTTEDIQPKVDIFSYSSFPKSLSVDCMKYIRRPKILVTEKEATRLRVYTNAIIRKSQMEKKKKQEFGEWMKVKMIKTLTQISFEMEPKQQQLMNEQRVVINENLEFIYKQMNTIAESIQEEEEHVISTTTNNTTVDHKKYQKFVEKLKQLKTVLSKIQTDSEVILKEEKAAELEDVQQLCHQMDDLILQCQKKIQ